MRYIATLAVIPFLAACMAETSSPPDVALGMPNPASVHCIKLGGKLENRRDATGAESGWCHLPDGRVIEEWELFRASQKT